MAYNRTYNTNGYHILPFPASRQIVIDSGRMGIRRHIVHGLLEFDVTDARELVHRHKAQTGESLSFTAYITACLAQAIAADPRVQAYRNWRNQLIVFDDVDVAVMIENELGGVAIPYVIRAANRKSCNQISAEIRAVQAQPPQTNRESRLLRLGGRFPRFMRDLFFQSWMKSPVWFKRWGGTVVVTSVGMFGQGGGWGIGFLPMHTLGLTVGGIAAKPALMNGQLVLREYLNVTFSFDHDIVDGAPAARFVQHFKQLVESAAILNSPTANNPQTQAALVT